MLSTEDTFKIQRHKQVESLKVEKYTRYLNNTKMIWNAYQSKQMLRKKLLLELKTFYNDKVSLYQDIIIITYAVNNKAPKYVKQKLTELKEEINNLTITGGASIPLSTMDKTRQKIIEKLKT